MEELALGRLKDIGKLDAIVDEVLGDPFWAREILREFEMEKASHILLWPRQSSKMIDLILQESMRN